MDMREVLENRIATWLDDSGSSVEYAEYVEGRWAVRMGQETRDVTTVWFTVGQRSLEYEAYVLPAGEGTADLFRQALQRNMRGWRTFFALDAEGGLVLRGRLHHRQVTDAVLDMALGELYETIEVGFRPLLRAMLSGRET